MSELDDTVEFPPDWASDTIFVAREGVEHGYGDYVLKQLLSTVDTWKDPFDRERIWAAIREISIEPWESCPNGHGVQEVRKFGSSRGFAGGAIYWTKLVCGCITDFDDTDDLRAAY
jgi:hypothetical protein